MVVSENITNYLIYIRTNTTNRTLSDLEFKKLMKIKWQEKLSAHVEDYNNTLICVVIHYPNLIKPVLSKIFDDFAPILSPKEDVNDHLSQIHGSIDASFRLFVRLAEISPYGVQSCLVSIVQKAYPFYKKHELTVTLFVKNLLGIVSCVPSVDTRRSVVLMVVSNSLIIDTNIDHAWLPGESLSSNPHSEDAVLFGKLTQIMRCFIHFINQDVIGLKDWLRVFEDTFLLISRVCQLQFIMLHVLRKHNKGFDAMALYLWRRVIDVERGLVIRLNSLSYLRSLLIHAEGVHKRVIKFCVGKMADWLCGFVDYYSNRESSPDNLSIFYNIFESLSSVLLEYVHMDSDVAVRCLDGVLGSRWNPLAFLRMETAELFVLVLWRSRHSFNAFSILRRNQRSEVDNSSLVGGLWDPFGTVLCEDMKGLVRTSTRITAERINFEMSNMLSNRSKIDDSDDILWDTISRDLAESCI